MWIVKEAGPCTPYLGSMDKAVLYPGTWVHEQREAMRFQTPEAARQAIAACIAGNQVLERPRVVRLTPSRGACERALLITALTWSATHPRKNGHEHAKTARAALKVIKQRPHRGQATWRYLRCSSSAQRALTRPCCPSIRRAARVAGLARSQSSRSRPAHVAASSSSGGTQSRCHSPGAPCRRPAQPTIFDNRPRHPCAGRPAD